MMKNVARRGFTPLHSNSSGVRHGALKSAAGFTLVEMLIVICIMALLMALLVVLIKGSLDRSKNAKSKALVEMLNQACQAYFTDFGTYPSPGGGGGYPSPAPSTTLHRALGSPLYMPVGFGPTGPTSYSTKVPYIEFKKDHLPITATSTAPTPPQLLNDAWERVINYTNPGIDHTSAGGGNHTQSVDIWSVGKDPATTTSGNQDDIANFIRDY